MAQEKADAGKAEVFLTTDFTDGTDGKPKAKSILWMRTVWSRSHELSG